MLKKISGKEQRLKNAIKESLHHQGLKYYKDIRLIDDDYDYWSARQAHEQLYPNTLDSFYV